MKKAVLLLAGLVALTNGLQAQDTVTFHNPSHDKYYYIDSSWGDRRGEMVIPSMNLWPGQTAKYYYTKDTLTICGILGCAIDWMEYSNVERVYDTSYERSQEYVRLYVPDSDTLRWLRQVKIHLRETPITFYANFDTVTPPRNARLTPMYELYFDSVVSVIDSFFVGMTYSQDALYRDDEGHYWSFEYPPIYLGTMGRSYGGEEYRQICHYRQRDDGSTYSEWTSQNWPGYTLFFPMIVHSDAGGDDSLAVQQVQLVDRLVAVQPNPATERVKVVSSCGMERLTAYDAAGKQMYRQEASGLSTTLDVSRWPAGTYILHVQTPMGTSTKRLVVTR